MCHDLISVNKKTLKVKYALDTFHEGRKCLLDKSSDRLLKIWDKLHELVESGEIKDIIEGKDIIKNLLPVFTVDQGKLIESVTDKYGFPNTDDNGVCMYQNTHFPTAAEEYSAGVEMVKESVNDAREKLEKQETRLSRYQSWVSHLKEMRNSL